MSRRQEEPGIFIHAFICIFHRLTKIADRTLNVVFLRLRSPKKLRVVGVEQALFLCRITIITKTHY